MTGIVLEVEVRERTGTGGARATRETGSVPGILYGGTLGPVAISLKLKEVQKAIRSGKFLSHMIEIEHKGERQAVLPRDVQWHPLSDLPVHLDLMRVSAEGTIKVSVPVRFIGHDTNPGLKKGGSLNITRHFVELNVAAGRIPEEIVVDLGQFEAGHVFHISGVTLPEGAKPVIDRDFTIATLQGRGGKKDDAEAEAAA